MPAQDSQASLIHVGGFRPSGDPLATHFGLRPVGLTGESWPVYRGDPLLFVCQLNLTAAPAAPPKLKDLALITLFVNAEPGALAESSGQDWCLRAYPSLDGLAPLPRPDRVPAVSRGFECRWELAEDDEAEPSDRTKIGGFPSEIQSEPWWDYRQHPAAPRFVLQVASEPKVGLAWGDGGMLYIARGTAAGCESQWFLDWQCY